YPAAPIRATASEVGGVDEGRARSIEHRHKRVEVAAERLERCPCRREIARSGEARHIGVAGAIYGNSATTVRPTAAEIGRVNERGTGWIKLRHEGVIVAATKGRLKRSGRCREACTGNARYVGVADRVHRDAGDLLTGAQIGGVDEVRAVEVKLRHEHAVAASGDVRVLRSIDSNVGFVSRSKVGGIHARTVTIEFRYEDAASVEGR